MGLNWTGEVAWRIRELAWYGSGMAKMLRRRCEEKGIDVVMREEKRMGDVER